MTELLTAAQMRAIEAAAIASGVVTGLELMERAGQGVVEAVFEEWPELAKGTFRALVLCGPGNNGGDGFVVARLLKDWGWEVEVFLYGDPERQPPDARVNYERWLGMGEAADRDLAKFSTRDADLIVDALFGTGLSRPIVGLEAVFLDINEEVLRAPAYRRPNCRVTSIDMPSGICSDSGRPLVGAPKSDEDRFWKPSFLTCQLVVTFHRQKLAHVLSDGPSTCSKTVVKDIGLPVRGAELAAFVKLIDESDLSQLAKKSGHKFSHGHAFILTGPSGHGGAARLSARGALRIGAGLVTLACPPEAILENAARLDAVMLTSVADAVGLADVLKDDRITAMCLGPGMGVDRAAALLPEALKVRGDHAPYVVLDADALTALSRDPALFAMLHDACVLTPHGGEFARLFPDIAERLAAPATKGPAYSKVDATREAAARAGCVVLFKGADTVIAHPDGRCSVNSAHYDRAAPWLATAGSGDVLAGFITGLLARGGEPMAAAETAAWLHVECARSFGPGMIAEDLPEELPKVFRALGL